MSISTTASHFPSIPNKPSNDLYAAIDMGTNSFKMLVVKADPTTGKFLKLNRLKSPVLLGQSTSPATRSTQCLTEHSQTNAISALNNFTDYLRCHQIDNYWAVATSAVREASNKEEFLERVKEEVGLDVEVLSGEEEGKYVYKGVLQFVPYYDKTVLCIDIGGGSTEFVVGNNGNVLFAKSLRLGHVTLSEKFVKNREILSMREYIRQVIEESGLVERVKGFGIEVVVGSSGTIRAMEKAVFHGYACGTGLIDEGFLFRESRRDWRFSREDLRGVVERLCGEEERIKRDGFFKRRSEFIVGGAVLLQEIFEVLGIEEMEVSDYALGEGVIAEKLAGVCGEYDLNVNAKWRSVMRFATRLNNKKRMKCAAQCAGIAKEIFEGLRKCDELEDNGNKLVASLNDKDLEYLEAACLLHNIGQFTGKKGYHKQSYSIIMNGEHIQGYGPEEIKFIALLARHHRKKFPKIDNAKLQEFAKEVKQKFRILCAVIRISVIIQQYQSGSFEGIKLTYSKEGLKVSLSELKNHPDVASESFAEEFVEQLSRELEHFEKVSQQTLSVLFPWSIS